MRHVISGQQANIAPPAFCLHNKAGWKSIRLRMEKALPGQFPAKWLFVHLEDHLPWLRSLFHRIGKFGMIYDLLCGRAAALRAIRAGGRNIIIGTYNNGAWLPARKGVRYFIYGDASMRQLAQVGYCPGKNDISRLARRLYNGGYQRMAERGHHFLCWSRWYAEALQREHGVPAGQISIVPPFVDTTSWTPSGVPRSPGGLKVVFIGADFNRKGGRVLMEAVESPELQDVEWHLVTKSPPSTSRSNVTCYTDFNSDAGDLRRLVQSCDLLVLPSLADISPLVVLEAAACGLPAVITRMAGIPELVDDGVTGTLLPEPTMEQLVAALKLYRDNPELIASHGAAAREKAVREFDTSLVVGRMLEALARHGMMKPAEVKNGDFLPNAHLSSGPFVSPAQVG